MFDMAKHEKKDAGNKFDSNRNPIPYYGNTIISFMNTEDYPIYQAAVWAQKEIMKCSFADKLAFLPPSSFHMTVLSLCREIDRGGPTWPYMIPADARFSQIDSELKKIVNTVPLPEHIKVEVDCCEEIKIILKPHSKEDGDKLKWYRDQVAEKTGIRHPWHDTFRYHLTLDYRVFELNEKEQEERDRVCARLAQELKQRVAPFEIPRAEFVIFNDMMSYEADLSKRGELY